MALIVVPMEMRRNPTIWGEEKNRHIWFRFELLQKWGAFGNNASFALSYQIGEISDKALRRWIKCPFVRFFSELNVNSLGPSFSERNRFSKIIINRFHYWAFYSLMKIILHYYKWISMEIFRNSSSIRRINKMVYTYNKEEIGGEKHIFNALHPHVTVWRHLELSACLQIV